MKRYFLGAYVAGFCVLIGQVDHTTDFLIAEQPKRKEAFASVQKVVRTMATTLKASANCIERLSRLQQQLVEWLTNAAENGRKGALSQKTGKQRGIMQKRLREFCQQIDRLNESLAMCLCTLDASDENGDKQKLSV